MMPRNEAEKRRVYDAAHADIDDVAMAAVEGIILSSQLHGACPTCVASEVVLLIMEQFMCRYETREEAMEWLTGDFVQDVLVTAEESLEKTYGKRH
jgi:hypothetical protein